MWSRVAQWHNWSLIVKLAGVVLIPVIFALTLGTLQIHRQIGASDDYSRLDRVVTTAAALRSAGGELQEERTRAGEFLAKGPITPDTLQGRFLASDRALDSIREDLHAQSNDNIVVRYAHDDANRQLARIPQLRQQVLANQIDPVIAVNTYTEITSSLLALDRALVGQVSSPTLSSTSNAVHAVAQISEEMRVQQALVLVGTLRSDLTSEMVNRLGAAENRRKEAVDEFHAVATPQHRTDYDGLYSIPELVQREDGLKLAMASVSTSGGGDLSPLMPTPAAWDRQSSTADGAVRDLQSTMDRELHRTAFALQDRASNLAGLEVVLLVVGLLLAGAVVAVVARQLLGSLHRLRRSALAIANEQLPRAVVDIRAGHGSRATVDRVPIDTTDEVGQVARAFDDVHAQAVALASEQADLRRNFSDSFINVSRRSQSLLERQLRLFEQLESDEEDPDQLATLFQLDHLSTRMRRNNENLMVLSGSDLPRRFSQPAGLADLVRAAVSEIEHYPRVILERLPEGKVVGYAGSDLVRLIAELLDNAANFSSPQTNVVVSGHRRGDGSIGLDIVDHGIGMKPDELARANEQLVTTDQVRLSTSRRMGLFVVGRLAARHNVTVELQAGPGGTGVCASILLSSALFAEGSVTQTSRRTNGNGQRGTHKHELRGSDDTLVRNFDWDAAERDAAQPPLPIRNGFHLAGATSHPNWSTIEARRDEAATTSGHSLFTPIDNASETAPYDSSPESLEDELSEREDQAPGEVAGAEAGTQGAADVAEEHAPKAEPDATLHTHNTDTPPADGTHTPHADDSEFHTPIFDDLASAWFQVSHPGQRADPGAHDLRWPARPANGSKGTSLPDMAERFPYSRRTDDAGEDEATEWSFDSDEDRDRAERVSNAQPTDYTEAGLPLRTPSAHLIAGSATAPEPPEDTKPQRDAEAARGRLASFQQGLRAGRHSLGADHQTARAETVFEDQFNWSFSSDPIAQRAESALNNSPDEYTTVGLPRRTPRAQLMPGAADEPVNGAISLQRSPDQMRGRLASFQKGVREGRHSLREPCDDTVDERR
jgi:signal transduction histidine kinase